jgi:hypothetical protein
MDDDEEKPRDVNGVELIWEIKALIMSMLFLSGHILLPNNLNPLHFYQIYRNQL